MSHSPRYLVVGAALGAVLGAAPAHAKDLRGRPAVGADFWLGPAPAFSIRYAAPMGQPAVSLVFEGDFGLDSAAGTAFGGGRVLYAVVAEDNMNLYATLGAAGGSVTSGTGWGRIQPGLEADLFLFGLENLDFSAGFGLDIDLGSASGVKTAGALLGGIHYWF